MMFKTTYLCVCCLFLTSLFTLHAQQGHVNISQDSEIEKLLVLKKEFDAMKTYKIQIFQSVDLALAKTEKENFLSEFEEWPVEIHWNTPNYKVWVGNFSSRLEADRALRKMKTLVKYKFRDAIIFQPKSN